MFEQDYIMRIIREMIRVILKLMFNIDTISPTSELLKESKEKQTLNELYGLVDEGKINEAENIIYDLTEKGDISNLKTALLFYSYLNDKDNSFFEVNDFSREEIKDGLMNILSEYGLNSIAEMFLIGL